jgi:hypothetical protein
MAREEQQILKSYGRSDSHFISAGGGGGRGEKKKDRYFVRRIPSFSRLSF